MAARTCGNCLHHEAVCACCRLYGIRRKARFKACSEWSDGTVERKGNGKDDTPK